MKNKTITVYELIGLIKDDKAPKEIKYYEVTYEFNVNNYYLKGRDEIEYSMFYKLAKGYMFLNDKVEILEENDEWKDIEEIDSWKFNKSEDDIPHFELANIINQLIKNQKYLKERLDNVKDDVVFDYWKDKVVGKDE